MPKHPDPPPKGKLRRIVRRRTRIPTMSELYEEASKRGMTPKEYVDWLNSMNADKSNRRNKSTSYDMGPIPYRKEKEEDA